MQSGRLHIFYRSIIHLVPTRWLSAKLQTLEWEKTEDDENKAILTRWELSILSKGVSVSV